MVTLTLRCCHCDSTNLIRHGLAQNGKQRFRCRDCRRTSRQNPGSAAHDATFKARVLAAYHERASMRGIARVFGISRQTLSTWLKKSRGPAAS
jgi:transposase-like protein